MSEEKSPQQRLMDKYKGKTFEVVNEQGWIRNNSKLSSMGFHMYCPYSVEGVDDICHELNELYEENQELRQDNDIKFWKLECIQSLNNNQMMLFELSRAMKQGYNFSDKLRQYLDELKEHDKEIREKHKRLFE